MIYLFKLVMFQFENCQITSNNQLMSTRMSTLIFHTFSHQNPPVKMMVKSVDIRWLNPHILRLERPPCSTQRAASCGRWRRSSGKKACTLNDSRSRGVSQNSRISSHNLWLSKNCAMNNQPGPTLISGGFPSFSRHGRAHPSP